MKLFNITTWTIIALLVAFTATPARATDAPKSEKVCKTDPATKKETCTKKVCKTDPNTKKETCKTIKIHEKLEGTKVPEKPAKK
jgi:Cu/Ag efflux protein CusF